MGIMDEPVENGVGQGWIADGFVPMIDGQLTGDDGLSASVAVREDSQQNPPLDRSEYAQPPTIEDQGADLGNRFEKAGVTTIPLAMARASKWRGTR